MSRRAQEKEGNNSWNLIPLTPQYLEAEHSGYVQAIEVALEDRQIRNIALSGNYGVGKSSILREVARRQGSRVVELSLSTLAPIEASNIDESVPVQATTPTNRIQQEIVKQLLYREDPGKTPASRFRRIERFRWRREVGSATLLGFAVAVVFLLAGWTARIAGSFTTRIDLAGWTHLIVWGVAAMAVLLVRWLSYGKLRIKQFSAGAATVTLDDNAVSYFDQYLDEIVYFFEAADRDIVIFEDIDRFNDSHIFETLRALNTLLNSSPQIKKSIRFIYAIKDSIFDRLGLEAEGRRLETAVLTMTDPAQAEAVRANRTKFFDLVIPVVPFITHRSARNLAAQLLGEIEHAVEPELLDLAAQYVPDMRLLKNVRNEFIVFRNRVFSGDGERLNLNETDLFAMMLYKSTHLTDFEAIRLGTSKLDALYKVSRDLVNENIKRLDGERRALRQQLVRQNSSESRSTRLGKLLIAHIKRTADSASALGRRRRDALTLSVDGSTKSDSDLGTEDFWATFVAADGDPELQQHMTTGYALTFSRSSLTAALGDPLDAESWDESSRVTLTEQVDEKTDDIAFLRGADLGDLMKRSDLLVTYKKKTKSFEAIAKAFLGPGLARQLVRGGHINRNFTLYTSTFHGDRVSTAATNFIIHHVERDLMDEHFELAPEDVDAVVRERTAKALKEPALYNIAILDHLLTTDVEKADIMIGSLATLGENQTRFLQAYLAASKQRLLFAKRFTVTTSHALVYLVSQVDLDDASRQELVNVALAHLSESKQRVDTALTRYLAAHYAELMTLTSDATEPTQGERIGALFAQAGIVVRHLKSLGEQVRPSFVSRNLYEITYENLAAAINNTTTVALDAIRTANETVYKYVLGHLASYLDTTDRASATRVDANEYFITVIEDVLLHGSPRLGDVVERAAPDCVVADLAQVSAGAWTALAEHRRFPATFGNIYRYVTTHGSVDAQLANVLAATSAITGVGAADEDSKVALAVAILAAQEQLPSTSLRAGLVASLSLSHYLNVDSLAAEAGDLFALLLKHDVIADDAESYAHLEMTNWQTRRGFIRQSTEFAKYMTPDLVNPDLAAILTDEEIDVAIKQTIVENAAAYSDVADSQGLSELAKFATRGGLKIPPDVVQAMAQRGVSPAQVILLLEPYFSTIGHDQLFTILLALGADYAKLTEVGRDRPKISNTTADRALLERLKQLGIVNSYDDRTSPIKVNKKHK